MNDNVFKLIMVYALIAWNATAIESGEASSATILALVGLVFALPFLLIVPIAGNFADKFSKQSMIVKLKVVEFIVMAFGITALYLENSTMLYVTMFLMSSQSAFFGPCKLGIIPDSDNDLIVLRIERLIGSQCRMPHACSNGNFP